MSSPAKQPVVVSAARTPIGRFLGSLASVSAPEVGATAIRAAMERSGVPGSEVEGGAELARRIQRRILEETRLTCSIGIAPNKLLAKLASEFDKPNGISVVTPEELESRIWPLACRKVNGIGPRTDEKLKAHDIHTIGDIAARDRGWLIEHFGNSYGAWLHDASWGRDDRPVITSSEPVSKPPHDCGSSTAQTICARFKPSPAAASM